MWNEDLPSKPAIGPKNNQRRYPLDLFSHIKEEGNLLTLNWALVVFPFCWTSSLPIVRLSLNILLINLLEDFFSASSSSICAKNERNGIKHVVNVYPMIPIRGREEYLLIIRILVYWLFHLTGL